MIKVAICDDEKNMLAFFEKLFQSISMAHDLALDIDVYTSGASLLKTYQTKPSPYHLILIDVCLENESGICIANAIRKYDDVVDIVFASNSSAFVFDAFESHPLYYIRKLEDSRERMRSILEKAVLKRLQNKKAYLSYEVGFTTYAIDLSTIQHIEVKNRTIYVFDDKNKEIAHFNSKLSAIEAQLEHQNFIRIHRSYIVNLEYAIFMKSDGFSLKSGLFIPIGRKYKPYVKDAFFNFLSDHAL